MDLKTFFDAYVQVLGYLIYVVIGLSFATAYYEWKNENKSEKQNVAT